MSSFLDNFAWQVTSSEQINDQITQEPLFKLAKKETKILNETAKNLFNNFYFERARKFLVDLKLLNNHVEIVQKSIFEAFTDCLKQERLNAAPVVLLFKLRKPVFLLSEFLTHTDIEVVVILKYSDNKKRNHWEYQNATKHKEHSDEVLTPGCAYEITVSNCRD